VRHLCALPRRPAGQQQGGEGYEVSALPSPQVPGPRSAQLAAVRLRYTLAPTHLAVVSVGTAAHAAAPAAAPPAAGAAAAALRFM
jgi:hypothetical protein